MQRQKIALSGPVADRLRAKVATFWFNPNRSVDLKGNYRQDIREAQQRLQRAIPHFRAAFPHAPEATIKSPLLDLSNIRVRWGIGRWFAKADHMLPIAGSIKARGGFNEVLTFAEKVASENALIHFSDRQPSYMGLEAKTLFAGYSVVVGSTGNLGLSVGLMASSLGFKTVVHMSRDAKQWKKDMLRVNGAEVVEHSGDYSSAVEQGRLASRSDPKSHFVDDERSVELFAGYGAAAAELAGQLDELGILVDERHPLIVYLPCGVGGAPGGITYGLKSLFGPNVHCFWAEPAPSPSMLLQLAAGTEADVSVYDLGLDNITEADGLAVATASPFVAPLMARSIAGIYTATDGHMLDMMAIVGDVEGLQVEPSAAISFLGPLALSASIDGAAGAAAGYLRATFDSATHVSWTTGGSLVPDTERDALRQRARAFAGHVDSFADDLRRHV